MENSSINERGAGLRSVPHSLRRTLTRRYAPSLLPVTPSGQVKRLPGALETLHSPDDLHLSDETGRCVYCGAWWRLHDPSQLYAPRKDPRTVRLESFTDQDASARTRRIVQERDREARAAMRARYGPTAEASLSKLPPNLEVVREGHLVKGGVPA